MKPRKLTREDHQLTETASVNLTEQRRIDRYPLRSQTCYVRTERRQGEVPAMHNDITTWRCETCGVWSFLSNHETFAACAGLEIDEESFGPTQSGVYYILPCVLLGQSKCTQPQSMSLPAFLIATAYQFRRDQTRSE